MNRKLLLRFIAALTFPCVCLIAQRPVFGAESAREFKRALPGYVFKFPADHSSHDDFKTEWWYYTGHLDGKGKSEKFGFELTFFRSGMDTAKQAQARWSVPNIYLAHFAVTDLQQQKFFFRAQTNRPGPVSGGADPKNYKVWNGGWSAHLSGAKHVLEASTPEYSLNLELNPVKPAIVHGINGVSQKAACKGCASHYYSMTRLEASGRLVREGKIIPVHGQVWMDHEFGSNQLTSEQVGWDWFSIQLDNNIDLMLYEMRLKSGAFDPNSSGTIVQSSGNTLHLNLKDYHIEVLDHWKSTATGATYPSRWRVSIPGSKAELTVTPLLPQQELVGENAGGITYWEGACDVSGTMDGKTVHGRAYVELTGYAGAFSSNI